jgi:RNA polymerase sigma factor (sigma-70 family)
MADAIMIEGQQKLGELFIREKERFLGFVRRRLFDLSGMDAEDILSEVTYNLLRRADLVSEVENLSAYIYRSLANRIADRQRQSVPHVAALENADPSQPSQPTLPPDARPRPDQSLQQAELRERLFHAIDALSPPERDIWIATEIDGQSFRELAEDWDEPIGTLLSRKSRATAKLREMLSDYKDYQ